MSHVRMGHVTHMNESCHIYAHRRSRGELQTGLITETPTRCNTLQHTATHCNTLQHTATHYNTLQHTATCRRSRGELQTGPITQPPSHRRPKYGYVLYMHAHMCMNTSHNTALLCILHMCDMTYTYVCRR